MSRTEGLHLPRLPTSHARVTSSRAIRPHAATGLQRAEARRRSLSEPSYTAYVGSPRQDIPHPVLSNAAMYDDVFDKEGRLLSSRNVPKFTSPLNTVGYNSLNDPHCRRLFLNNRRLRSHLINLGLITDDLKVVATTREQRQKIRAHELLERKELLAQKLEQREKERLQRLSQPFHIPQTYHSSMARQEYRRGQWTKVQDMKTQKVIKQREHERAERVKRLEQKKAELAAAMEDMRLQEQARRNALRVQQELAEVRAYDKTFGKTAQWHRDSDRINNRMIVMQMKWAKQKRKNVLSESFPPASLSKQSSQSHQEESKHQVLESLERMRDDGVRGKMGRKESLKKTEEMQKGREGVVGEKEREEEGEGEGEGEGRGEREEGGKEGGEGEGEGEERAVLVLKTEELVSAISEQEEGALREAQEDERERETPSPIKEHDTTTIQESLLPPSQSPPHTSQGAPPHTEQFQPSVLDGERAKHELTQIITNTFYSIDAEGSTGYISTDDFLQVLNSRDLGFQLEENEQIYIANQVDLEGTGVVAYENAATLVPDLLFQLFALRAQQSMEYYGYYVEEEWIQIYPVSGGVVYLNKLTGTLQTARPEDFRPYLKDEVFEDSIVELFENADIDRDGLIDYEDFYNLLASPLVASRVYRSQMEQLLALFQTETADTDGTMHLAMFSTVASSLLLMIYQNSYPDVEDWIELESKKFGPFWLNKTTGEVILHLQQRGETATTVGSSDPVTPATEGEVESRRESTREKPQLKSRKKKKHKKKAEAVSENGPAPPKLVPRPKSRPSLQRSSSDHPTLDHDLFSSLTPPSSSGGDTPEDFVKPVSSRSRLIGPATFETIPEEDESALEDSLVVQANIEEDRSERKEGENDGNDDKVAKTNVEEDSSDRREGEGDGNGDTSASPEKSLVARANVEEDINESREVEVDGNGDKGAVVVEVEEVTGFTEGDHEKVKDHDIHVVMTETSEEKTDAVEITS